MAAKPKRSRAKQNVVSIWGSAPPVPHVDPNVVAKLEQLLAMAKDGACVGLAYVAIQPTGNGLLGRCGKPNVDSLIACTARLYHDLLQDDREAG